MPGHLLIATAVAAWTAAGASAFASLSDTQSPPPSANGSVEVVTIPLDDDPRVSAITGTLFEPLGAGPFPAVLHLPGCDGPSSASAVKLQKVFVDEDIAEGEAVLILDLFTPRGLDNGDCGQSPDMVFLMRRAEDAYAALRAMADRPEIDAKRVILQGYGDGAIAAALAVRPGVVRRHGDHVFSGVVTYSP